MKIVSCIAHLRCDKNLPVACPEPSQPGMGHLQQYTVTTVLWLNYNLVSPQRLGLRPVFVAGLRFVCPRTSGQGSVE